MRMVLFSTALLLAIGSCGTGPGGHEAKDTLSLGGVADTVKAPPDSPRGRSTSSPSEAPEKSLQLSGLRAGDTLRSPALVQGQARGGWYFEGQFVLKLYDSLQRLLALVPAKATKDWMTDDFVPFRGELTWKKYSGPGTLVLEADNPSGDEARAKRVAVGVWLKKAPAPVRINPNRSQSG